MTLKTHIAVDNEVRTLADGLPGECKKTGALLELMVALVLCGMGATKTVSAPFAQWFDTDSPNGCQVRVWGEGDEYAACFESEDGHTVVYDKVAGGYVFAEKDEATGALLSTGIFVGEEGGETNRLSAIPLHLRDTSTAAKIERARRIRELDETLETTRRWEKLKEAARSRNAGIATSRDAGTTDKGTHQRQAPGHTTTGTAVGLALLVDFPAENDSSTTLASQVHPGVTKTDISNLFNAENFTKYGNSCSVRKYFDEVSGGKLCYTNIVLGWFKMPYPRSHYDDPSVGCGDCAKPIIVEVFRQMREDVDYSWKYEPILKQLTLGDYSAPVAVNVLFAGETTRASWNYGLWAHHHSFGGTAWGDAYYTVNGARRNIWHYQISPITSTPCIATICHESGHMVCGFPDLYSYDPNDSGGGVGYFSLMHGSSKSNWDPQGIDAYLRAAAGWVTPKELGSAPGERRITCAISDVWKWTNPSNSKEYFLIENRRKKGRDATLPGEGILIWRCNEERNNTDSECLAAFAGTDAQYRRSNELSLEQADGLYEIERWGRLGDSNDLWHSGNDSARYASLFSDDTVPCAKWENGDKSGLVLSGFSAAGDTMTFRVGKSDQNLLTVNPNGGVLVGSNFGNKEGTSQSASVTLTQGTYLYWILGTAQLDGYTFGGWWTSATGGEQVYDQEGKAVRSSRYWDENCLWQYPGNLTVYAHWSANAVPPTAPTVSIWTYGTNANASSITVEWSGGSGATSYNLYRSTSSTRPSSAYKTGVTSPYMDTDSNLKPGVKYYYWVEAKNPSGSAFSSFDWGNRAVTLTLGSAGTVVAGGGDKSFAVTANTGWSATTSASWITLTGASGSGSGTCSFTAPANGSTSSRTGTIVVTAGSGTAYPKSVTNTVTQSGKTVTVPTAPTVSIATYGTNANGVSITVKWSGGSGATSYNLYRSASNSRPGSAYKTGVTSPYTDTDLNLLPGVKYYYWVEAKNSAGSAFSNSDWGNRAVSLSLGSVGTVAASGGTKSFSVTANTSWSAKSSVSWIALNAASGSGNGTCSFTVSANGSTGTRTGKIVVTAGSGTAYPKSVTNTVTQVHTPAPGPILTLGAASRSFTASAANSKELSVTANVAWTAKSNVSWLEVKTESGTGSGKIVYNVKANTGSGSRTGTITVTAVVGGSNQETFTVTQEDSPALALGAESRSFTSAAATGKELAVTARVSWTAKSSASWLIVKTASGSGNGKIVYNVKANTGGTRTGKITVTGGGNTATFTVTQSGSGPISLAQGRTFTAAAANNKELSVTASGAWTAKSSTSWLVVKTASGSGNGKIVYNVKANTGSGTRTGKITVTGGGVTATFTVTQSGTGTTPSPVLTLGAASRTFTAAAANSKELSVTANVSWTAKSSATSWLAVKTASGSGNGKVVYNVAANTGSASRTGTITVTGGGITRTFTVTQDGKGDTDGGSSANLSFTAAGGTKAATFTGVPMGSSSLSYSVSWLSANYQLSSGNMTAGGTFTATVNVTVTANTTGGSRSGKVTLTAGGNTYTVNVTQAAAKAKSASKGAEQVWVTTSDGSNGDAVADADAETGWSPSGLGGAWVALTFEEPRDIGNVAVKGYSLPEGLRVLASEDGDDWSEEGCDEASYLWVVLPDEGAVPTVTEIECGP